MVLWNKQGAIKKYDDAQTILKEFCVERVQWYHKRKANLLCKLRRDRELLAQKKRFILAVISGEVVVSNRKKVQIVKDLIEKRFLTKDQISTKYVDEFGSKDRPIADDDDEEGGEKKKKTSSGGQTGYEYLLGMPLWSLTHERVQDITGQLNDKEKQLRDLEVKAPEQIWDDDLKEIIKELDQCDAMDKILR